MYEPCSNLGSIYAKGDDVKKDNKKSNKLIGVLFPDISNNVFGRILQGVNSVVTPLGYNTVICETNGELEKEIHFLDVLKNKQVEGIIMANVHIPEEHMLWIHRNNKPVIYVCQDIPDFSLKIPISSVNMDNQQAICDMVHFLYNMGHKNIAFIGGPSSTQNAIDRFEGYKAALAEYHIPFEKELTIESDYSYNGGYKAMETLFTRPISFTAVFAANDLMGYGAMEYIYKIGKEVPRDYSLAGFDNISFPAVFQPVITSVEIPAYRFGMLAAKKVINCIEKKEVIPLIDVIDPVIVDKGSIREI